MKKKKYLFWSVAAAGYLGLLQLLVVLEHDSGGIHNLYDAFWYSLTTLTTVGYGDLYPTTAAGRLVGLVFMLLSLGALASIISFGISWLTGTGLPKLRIRTAKHQHRFVFDGCSNEGLMLARIILRENPDALCIFAETERLPEPMNNCLCVSLSTQETAQLLSKNHSPKVIFTGPEADRRMAQCGELPGCRVVCQTALITDGHHANVRFFDRSDLCASMYWLNYPLHRDEKKVVLVGFGKVGRAILERALESCIFAPIRTTEYHVFGTPGSFLNDHITLPSSVSIGRPSEEQDSLLFHEDDWSEYPNLLNSADRILFCADSQEDNIRQYYRLLTYFPVKARVQLYNRNMNYVNLPCFGEDDSLFTPEIVLRDALEQLAMDMHNIYRAAYPEAPSWEELSPFLRRSNLAAAAHLREKLRFLLNDDTKIRFTGEDLRRAYRSYQQLHAENPSLCRRIEHDRWMRFHSMYNWHYDPVRDNDARLHPMMVPFEKLDETTAAKDDYSWDLIEKLAEKLGDRVY